MPLNQLAAEEESQTCAGDTVSGGIAGAGETGKEPGLLLVGDTDAVIMDMYLGAFLILGFGQPDVNGSALRRIFDGITNQIQQDLLQPVAVSLEPDGFVVSRQVERMFFGGDLQPLNHLARQRHQIKLIDSQYQPPALQARNINNIACQGRQSVGLFFHHRETKLFLLA